MVQFNAADAYFGTYVRFLTANKNDGAALNGPDNAVGDIGTISWKLDEHMRQQAWLVNPYGAEIGYLDAETSHTLALYEAKGWTIRYVLSVVAYSELPEPSYWGQAAIIAYAPRYVESFEVFLNVFARRMADGLRPDPDLGANVAAAIAENPESWQPGSKVKMPEGDGRIAILKDHRTLHDKLLDQARKRNIGCLIVGWAFIISLVALVVWGLRSIGIF